MTSPIQEVRELEKRLQIRFNDISLLLRALTHRSYLNENPGEALEDNERLEFLGDAVLDFVVGDYLYNHFPEMDEGGLTKLRAALVRTETLAKFARDLDLGLALRLGYGEAENNGRTRLANLCAGFEAVVGAIYLDQGLGRVATFMQRLLPDQLEQVLAGSLHKDAKSEFQIWAQGRFNVTPRYEQVGEFGPDHEKVFTVQVLLDDEIWGVGAGRSKQLAAQAAAQLAMERADAFEDEEFAATPEGD